MLGRAARLLLRSSAVRPAACGRPRAVRALACFGARRGGARRLLSERVCAALRPHRFVQLCSADQQVPAWLVRQLAAAAFRSHARRVRAAPSHPKAQHSTASNKPLLQSAQPYVQIFVPQLPARPTGPFSRSRGVPEVFDDIFSQRMADMAAVVHHPALVLGNRAWQVRWQQPAARGMPVTSGARQMALQRRCASLPACTCHIIHCGRS